jgi:hypothetical protein
MHTFLQIAGLVRDQHRIGIAEMLDNVIAQVITQPVGVNSGPVQQVLHPVRACISGVFCDRPAVLTRQVRQQTEQQTLRPQPGLDPGEPAADPAQQPIDRSPQHHRLYAVAHGHRLIIRRPHNRR